ncbi:MAG: hypothetical protein U0L18_08375 [Acutalibacteraceae bacterium]|nr:hypothetical protein [Acutalibacteraceae bacterium]
MGIHLDEQAFITAATDMELLKERNQKLRDKLETMYSNLTKALDTPAGHAIEFTGRDLLLTPIDDMNKVIGHMSKTLNIIIGCSGERTGRYYDKLFTEYDELDRIIKNKTTY